MSWEDDYEPKTELGRRLLAWRREYIKAGGKLLSQDEVLELVRENRGEAEPALDDHKEMQSPGCFPSLN